MNVAPQINKLHLASWSSMELAIIVTVQLILNPLFIKASVQQTSDDPFFEYVIHRGRKANEAL